MQTTLCVLWMELASADLVFELKNHTGVPNAIHLHEAEVLVEKTDVIIQEDQEDLQIVDLVLVKGQNLMGDLELVLDLDHDHLRCVVIVTRAVALELTAQRIAIRCLVVLDLLVHLALQPLLYDLQGLLDHHARP